MIGFRSVQHQGWAGAKANNHTASPFAYDAPNPYPQGCVAFYEYQDGCNAFRRGDVIDCGGNIIEPHARVQAHKRTGQRWGVE